MSAIVEVEGTLREDGTLVLDEKPALPPGRVKVRVEPSVDLAKTEIHQFFERMWAEQRARGHVPRSREEIDAELEAARNEDEERLLGLERISEEAYRARQQAKEPG
ncbi:MAG: hypothetical protein K2W96_24045 [Gemmataceae bacterium]|nr:hypothetical protein [Gemmataceae bacterium]